MLPYHSFRSAVLTAFLALFAACDGGLAQGPIGPGPEDKVSVDRLVFEGGADAEVHFRKNGETLIVLVNGAGYDRRIWSQRFAGKSMLATLLEARYAVALIDLPGGGAGAMRPGGTITLAAQATSLATAWGQLKGRFPRMYTVGMTSGGLITVRAQADTALCRGIIVQSWTPTLHASNITQVDQDLFTDPAKADREGYVNIPKGIRDMFYNAQYITTEAVMADRGTLNVFVPTGMAQAWVRSFDSNEESHVGALTGPVLAQYGLGDKGLAPPAPWPGQATVRTYGDLGTIFDLHTPDVADKTRVDLLAWLAAQEPNTVR